MNDGLMIVDFGCLSSYKGRELARSHRPGSMISGPSVSQQFQARLSDLYRTVNNARRGQDHMVNQVLFLSTLSSIQLYVDLLSCVCYATAFDPGVGFVTSPENDLG